MNEYIIFEVLRATVIDELQNEARVNGDRVEITLPNGTVASVNIVEVDCLSVDRTNCAPRVNDYVFQHDYGEIGENRANRLLLRNLRDVQDYAIDVAQHNICDVTVYDDVVVMQDRIALKIAVEIVNR